jgi:hypothetical protein
MGLAQLVPQRVFARDTGAAIGLLVTSWDDRSALTGERFDVRSEKRSGIIMGI